MSVFFRLYHSFIPSTETLPQRFYALDWLRVSVFALLIFYHVGMMYVANWGFHIKSDYSSQNLESVMLLVNPWRMPILWLISGIAIRFVLAKVSLTRFIVKRSTRLLIPLFFGILVVVPPQLYYEMTFNGDLSVGYWEFYHAFFDLNHPMFKDYQPGIWPHIDVNHLWYLRELWTFSLYLIPLLPLLNSKKVEHVVDKISRLPAFWAIIIMLVPVMAISLIVEDTREPLGFTFLVYGYLIGWKTDLWERLKAGYKPLLFFGVVCYAAIILFYNMIWLKTGEQSSRELLVLASFLWSLDRVIWVLAILALASRFLNKQSRHLQYFNEAVYPYYILHQTVIIVVGFELSQFALGPIIEPLLLLLITFTGCAVGFELIRRFDLLRPLFGLKMKSSYHKLWIFLGNIIAILITVLIGVEILI